jgi:hypothetical protein
VLTDCDNSTVRSSDFGNYSQAQPSATGGARTVGFQPDEPVEDSHSIALRDTGAIVGDSQDRVLPRRAYGERDA